MLFIDASLGFEPRTNCTKTIARPLSYKACKHLKLKNTCLFSKNKTARVLCAVGPQRFAENHFLATHLLSFLSMGVALRYETDTLSM